VTLPAYSQLPVRDLLEARLHGVVVEDGVKVYERLAGKLAIESLMPNNLIFQKDFRKSEILLVFRRAFSLIAAAFGLVLALPLMGVIALLIKLDSAGPVLFIQERVGLMGRNFLLLKFRTMRPVNGKTSEWVRDNGNRITRVGKWLRKFRLDELPQLVNVLLGDMDLVGPRPHPVSNFRLFVVVLRNAPDCGIAIPYYSLRSAVRPGITGWAQIRYGYANDLEEEIEKIRYDLYYIKHMSLWFDLRIIFDTVKIALLGRGSESPHAYRAESAVESEA
ncbi:MAG TPA: sugar transferase, partial [Nitrospiria bacterium]|nr:sugar transferase [Nitrospiria bacterium]